MAEPAHSIVYSSIVDLSHPVDPYIPLWPGDPPVEFQTVTTLRERGYFLRRFSMGEHTGTHLSTPSAFYADGAGPDEFPDDSLVATAAVIDVSRSAVADPDYGLLASDVLQWERRNGIIPADALVVLHTGWWRRWGDPRRFINLDSSGVMHTPGFGLEAARVLLHERRVAGLATDAPGIDPGADPGLSISRLVLSQPRLALECLNNLDQLPATGATIVVGRLKLVGGSGSPAAVLALVP
jgi:kynurenine formamidase